MKLKEMTNAIGSSAIVYGESGIGKTYFCGTLSGKTLIIAAEANGIKTLANCANIDNIDVVTLPSRGRNITETLDKIRTFFDDLFIKDLPYDNIVLDSATELANFLMTQRVDLNKNGGVPSQQNYLQVQWDMRRFLTGLRDLATLKGKRVVIIALEGELNLAQSAEATNSKTHPLLTGRKFSTEAEGWVDIVAHMEKTSSGERYFRLVGTDTFVAKDRFGRPGCVANGDILFSRFTGKEPEYEKAKEIQEIANAIKEEEKENGQNL